ncbi:unnamed protein product, partial [Brassica rapa]
MIEGVGTEIVVSEQTEDVVFTEVTEEVCGSFFFYRFRRHLGFWSWCLGIRVLGICNVVSSFWKRHFAIEADRETIE